MVERWEQANDAVGPCTRPARHPQILWITALPPGIWHIAALLFLMASLFKLLADAFGTWSTTAHYIPVMGFVTAAHSHHSGTMLAAPAAAATSVPAAAAAKPVDGNATAHLDPRMAGHTAATTGYGGPAGGAGSGGGGGVAAEAVVVHTAN